MTPVRNAEEFSRTFDVSRETSARIETYLALLGRWNPRINLVSRSTLADAWHRHAADSAQLWRLAPSNAGTWLDLGSGAGFPGLVIAAIAAEKLPALAFHLVESDQRKAAFLVTAAREMGLSARAMVHARRIEDLPPVHADVLSARALAPLTALLPMVEKHRRPEGTALFPKGATVHKEIAEASEHWRFDHKLHPSLTEQEAAIVEIGAIDRA